MSAMLEAKLPPPRPAVAVTISISQNGVSGRVMKYASAIVGTNSSAALRMVQFRPPNWGTAIVYGNRISEPTSPGKAMI
jgi:hypothetical protein